MSSKVAIGNYLEKLAKKELEEAGYNVIRATRRAIHTPKGIVSIMQDFFSVFDLIGVKDYEVRFVQTTTDTGLSHHKAKMEELFPYKFVVDDYNKVTIELWVYTKSSKNRWQRVIHYYKNRIWICPSILTSYQKQGKDKGKTINNEEYINR